MPERDSFYRGTSNSVPYPERSEGVRGNALDRILRQWTGRFLAATGRGLDAAGSLAEAIIARGEALENIGESDFDDLVESCRGRLVMEGFSDGATAEAFALARESTRRVLGFQHHKVQLIGGLMMLDGNLAEMETGEGKTITALLSAACVALAGIPVHVVTVNQYLATRDSEQLTPIYRMLGLSVGLIDSEDSAEQRKVAYRCDVTYCTNKDLVFDYLRDRMAVGQVRGRARRLVRELGAPLGAAGDSLLLRGLFFAIVDEADSVLIDEARTPLILSATGDAVGDDDYRRIALDLAQDLVEGEDFRRNPRSHDVELLRAAEVKIMQRVGELPGIWRSERSRHEIVSQALVALHLYEKDLHYIVDDGKVQIVDEYTGRVMPDRAWENGLHQMIEAKEDCESTSGRKTIARITYQRFFRRYLRLSGMTGTISEAAGEIYADFGMRTVRIPTHHPLLRAEEGALLLASEDEKWRAIAESAQRHSGAGRPVLIGTRSVGASESLSLLLDAVGLEHTVLNARQDKHEAEVISQAGGNGFITVATNMAGRGTDIKLSASAKEAGGLHVILTEFHESSRIDRQLFGRSARQGDPGSYEMIVSMEDEIFRKFAGKAVDVARTYLAARTTPDANVRTVRLLRRHAQSAAERHNRRIRQQTVKMDHELDRGLSFAGQAE